MDNNITYYELEDCPQLSDDELLSDHAYYYSKEHKQIYMPEVVHSFCA